MNFNYLKRYENLNGRKMIEYIRFILYFFNRIVEN